MKSASQSKNLNLPSVSIVRTTPKVSEEEFFSYKRCYLGISLDNPIFQGRTLEALLLWAVGNFDRCLVVVGDYLCRFNSLIFNGLKNEAAPEAAKAAGDSFVRQLNELFKELPKDKINLTRWGPCLGSVEYKKSRAVLDDLFVSDSDFRASVEKDASSFVTRQTRRNQKLAVSMEDAIELSCQYLLEEIAVFSALSEQGWKVELYPGPELHVLIDVAKGKYSRIPQGLKERINVELRICEGKAD